MVVSNVPTGARDLKSRPWQDEIVYFAMTDRFRDGDSTHDADCDRSNPDKFHGGDWQGIIDRLDSIKKLGATTLWISPTTENDQDFLGKAGYHGYWPHDFYKTEPHFGSMQKLQELVSRAHDSGMKVVIDLVLNHTGYNHPWTQDPSKYRWYHHNGNVGLTAGMEKGSLFGLPDLAQENPEVSTYLHDMTRWWIDQTGADGYRLDALPHMPATFVKSIADDMHATQGKNFLVLGEYYTSSPSKIAQVQKATDVDSLFDFPLANAIRSAVGKNESLGTLDRVKTAWKIGGDYPGDAMRLAFSGRANAHAFHDVFKNDGQFGDPNMMGTFIENHDMPRFLTYAGPQARDKFKLANLLMFAFRGIPCVYYGAEDGMGASLSDVRADKRDGADPDMAAWIGRLAHLRQNSEALRRGRQDELLCDNQVYAFSRTAPGETVIGVANVSGEEQVRDIPMPGGHGQRIENLLTGEVSTCQGPSMRVTLGGHAGGLYRIA